LAADYFVTENPMVSETEFEPVVPVVEVAVRKLVPEPEVGAVTFQVRARTPPELRVPTVPFLPIGNVMAVEEPVVVAVPVTATPMSLVTFLAL
jgi:hypothetical protein